MHFLCDNILHTLLFRCSFKEKCPLSGAKTQVKYVNPGTVLLRRYRYILQCFYYVASGKCYGGSEFKYQRTVIKNVCSIMLKICPTPNPNLPNSVNKCKTDIKSYLLMRPCHFNFLICRFELLCQIMINITRDSNRSSSPPKYIFVLHELPNKLLSMKTQRYEAGYVRC